ncbi:MAG TPA: hypothetical protein VGO18_36715 [Steroidobacteraceae bacterium]|jgi:hypothetical protein|nr:hypothetical protein [Steroidobacteraceae bacterium]
MNANNPETWVIAAVLVLALIAIAFLIARERKRRQSRRLQERFGPEYGRVVAQRGDRKKAESELKAREQRVERLTIVALAPADAAKFGQAWSALQGRFIDNPKGVVMDADRLVRDLMVKRGYPMVDFERRAADISVDHPALVETYRSAQAIALRDQRGEASTEELRKAVVYYRTLFDELLEVRTARQPTERDTVVHS